MRRLDPYRSYLVQLGPSRGRCTRSAPGRHGPKRIDRILGDLVVPIPRAIPGPGWLTLMPA
jgi:hypothetical protein